MSSSARDDEPIELTNVRYRELDPRRKKNGRCEYLVTAHGAIGHTVRYSTTNSVAAVHARIVSG